MSNLNDQERLFNERGQRLDEYRQRVTALERDLAASEQRCRELEADAERYRAIRAEGWWISQYDVMVNVFTTGERGETIGVGETLDAAIDAAIAAQRQKEGE